MIQIVVLKAMENQTIIEAYKPSLYQTSSVITVNENNSKLLMEFSNTFQNKQQQLTKEQKQQQLIQDHQQQERRKDFLKKLVLFLILMVGGLLFFKYKIKLYKKNSILQKK